MKVLKSSFYRAEDVAKLLDVSKTTAYRIIKNLNNELSEAGKIVIAGKISKRYFEEKIYM